ncbi:MAG: ABC transporter substrate-binding protein [Pseudomonadota bacterium]
MTPIRRAAFGKMLFAMLAGAALFATLAHPARAEEATQEKELVFGGFGGSLQKALQSTVIPAFEKKYGVRVIYVTGTSNQILAKVKTQKNRPQIDVIWANDTTHYQGKAEGLFAKVDPAKVPNLVHLYEFAKDPDGIGVVMGIQSLGIQYNTEVFKQKGWSPPTSWADLWDEKYKGHVVAYNMPIGYTNLVLSKVAALNGGSNEQLEPAWAKFKALIPHALAFVDPPAQIDALFGTGSAWIGFNGSARVADLANQGAPVALILPKEGGILYPQQFDIVKDAPHPELAQKFIDFTLSPESQRQIAEAMLLGPVNKTVTLDPAVAAKVPYGPEQVEKLEHLDISAINKDLQALTSRWTAMVGGR